MKIQNLIIITKTSTYVNPFKSQILPAFQKTQIQIPLKQQENALDREAYVYSGKDLP